MAGPVGSGQLVGCTAYVGLQLTRRCEEKFIRGELSTAVALLRWQLQPST